MCNGVVPELLIVIPKLFGSYPRTAPSLTIYTPVKRRSDCKRSRKPVRLKFKNVHQYFMLHII